MRASLLKRMLTVTALTVAVGGIAAEKNMVKCGYAADAMTGSRWKCSQPAQPSAARPN